MLFICFGWTTGLFAVNRVSTGSGNWTTAATWSPAGVPATTDNITIQAGHTVTVNNTGYCLSLTVNGTVLWTQNRRLHVYAGGCIINPSGDLAGTAGRLNLRGNLVLNAVTSNNALRVRMQTNNNLVISGTGSLSWLDIRRTVTNTGNITVRTTLDGNSTLTNAANATLNLGCAIVALNNVVTTANGNTVNYNGATAQTVMSNNYYNLVITKPSGIVASLGSSCTVSNNLTIVSGTFDFGGNNFTCNGTTSISGTMRVTSAAGNKDLNNLIVNATGTWNSVASENYDITGNLHNDGVFTANNGTYALSGAAKTISGASPITIATMTCTGTRTNNANLTLTSSFGGNGIFSQGAIGILNLSITSANFTVTTFNASAAGNLVNYSFAGNQNVRIPNDGAYHHLTAGGTGLKSLLANTLVNGDMLITSGLTTTASNFNMTVGGNWTDTGTFTCNAGTVTFNGSTNQLITRAAGETFFNLVLAGSASKILGGPVTALNDITISSTFNVSASNYAVSLRRNWTNTGTFVPQNGTVTFNGTAANQIILRAGGETFYNLVASGLLTKQMSCPVTVTNNLTISSTLDVSALNFALRVGGSWTNTGTFNPRSGTVTLNGAAQLVTKAAGETFFNLIAAGSGTKTLGGPITVSRDLTISTALDVSASSYAVNVGRNFTNNGTFTAQNGTVTLNGTIAQSINGSSITTFRNLTLNNATGASIAIDANLRGSLTLSSGTFTTTGFNFTLISDALGTARIAAITAGNITGNIIMQRYLAPGPTSWRMLSCPVSGRTLNDWKDDFIMSGFPGSQYPTMAFKSVYTYDETVAGIKDLGYVAATNITNPIIANKGYYCYIGPVPLTIDVTGPPAKFNQVFTLTRTSSAGAAHDGWNMIGNPYPSSIDWDAAGWTKTRLNNAIYVWNPSLQQYASYVAGIGTNGGTKNVPSSQAFWVQANAAAPALSCTENVKTPVDQAYMKTSTNYAFYYLKLKMKGNNQSDETFIRFDQVGTTGFDQNEDAHKIFSTTTSVPHLCTFTSGMDLSINTQPLISSTTSIPVRAKVGVTGTYTISRDSLMNLPMGCCLILEDLLTGIKTNLRINQSYSFSIKDTTKAPRFLLHVGAPFYKNAFGTSCSGASDGYAVAKGSGTGPWDYEWLDINTNSISKVMNAFTSDTLKGLKAGTYFIRVTDPNSLCGIITDTVVIQEPQALASNSVYANVNCNGNSDGMAGANPSGGASPYTYSWSNGSTAQSISGLLPGTYYLTITDNNGCVLTDSMIVTQPALLQAQFGASNDTVYLKTGATIFLWNNSAGASFYAWDFNDGSAVDNSFNPVTHTYTSAGIYPLKLKVSNKTCSDSTVQNIVVLDSINSVGIREVAAELSGTKLIQTRSGVYIDFNFSSFTKVSVGVYTSLGQQVMAEQEMQVGSTRTKLGLPELASGIYYVRIRAGEMTETLRFSK